MTRSFRVRALQVVLPAAALFATSCDSDRVVAPVPTVMAPAEAALESHVSTLPTACPEGATKWLTAVNGNWLDAARWSAGVPTATSPACIDLPGSYIVTLQAAFAATTVRAQSVFVGDAGAAMQPILRITQGILSVSTDVTAHGRIEVSPGTAASVRASGMIGVAATGILIAANTGSREFEAAVIENDGTINAGSGLSLRGTTIVNRGSIILASGRQLLFRGPTSGGAPTVTFEAGSVDAAGTYQQQDGTLIVAGGTVTGTLSLIAVDELRIEHDAGGRFNLIPLSGMVPPTTSRLNGTIGPTQHVWLGNSHLTVETSGLVNQGLLTVEHMVAFQKTGTVLRIVPDAILVNEGTLNLVSGANSGALLSGAITNASGALLTNVGSGVPGIIAMPFINHGTLRIGTAHLRIGEAADGSDPEVVLEDGILESTAGRYQQTRGSLTVRGGAVTGQLDLIALSELNLEHDAGGRFNIFAVGGFVPPTTTRLSGTIGSSQHVWMGTSHLTVETTGLINEGLVTLEGFSALGKTGVVLKTIGDGVFTNAEDGTITMGGTGFPAVGGHVINEGLITNTSDANLAGNPLINRGVVRAGRAGTSVMLISNTLSADPPPVFINDGGTLDVLGRYSHTRGRFEQLNGTVTGAGSTTFTATRFSGFGTWGRALALSGASVLAPGLSPGRLAITGDYAPSSTTVTEIELAGSASGTGYDQLAVANTARFAGALSVSLGGGFIPAPCQAFEVVTYAARTGTFTNATTPIDVGGGIRLRQVYTPTALVLVAYKSDGPNVHPTQVEVSVDGVNDSYDVCVGAGTSVVTVSPDDQVTVDKQTLTFGASQLPQTVTVSASPGATRSTALITHTATGGVPVANVTVLISGVVPADVDPPVTTAVAAPPPNLYGWNNSNVTISLTASDAGSGVAGIVWQMTGAQTGGASVSGSATHVTVTAEGKTTLTYFARDVAGNEEAPKARKIKIDKTAPTVVASREPPPNAAGWNNTDVTATFSATDALSGISGAATAQVIFSTNGANQSATRSFADSAGNIGSATISGISIDKVPPTISCLATPDRIWPPTGKLVAVSLQVNVAGASGFTLERVSSNEPEAGDIVDFVAGTADTNGRLLASRLGGGTGRVYTFEYRAHDPAGNTANAVCEVRVPHDQARRGT